MGFMTIYKPGQGKWVRVLSAAGFGMIVLAAAAWLWTELTVIQGDARQFLQGLAAVSLIGGYALLMWWLLNKPRIADFMIATEAEMRKVNWPTRKEIVGSTIIVIGGTLLMAALLFIVDFGFANLFRAIGILKLDA